MEGAIAALARTALSVMALLLCVAISYAGSATWNVNPNNTDWNNSANWTPLTVPNGPGDTATFDTTSQAGISISAHTEVNGLVFNPSTQSFAIFINPGLAFTISGSGITNNSGHVETLIVLGDQTGIGRLAFTNSANAGNPVNFYMNGGTVTFYDSATAGNATFTGNVAFYGSSTAANATLKGASFHDFSTAGAVILGTSTSPSFPTFFDSSTAGSASVTGGATFNGDSSAMTATLSAINGGSIVFSGNATGDMARVNVSGTGNLNITGHTAPGVSIGSLEGDGSVTLGINRLTVGANNIDTTFSGHIQDSVGKGSLNKIGTGTLVLPTANTYGDTIIDQGVIRASHDGVFGTPLQSGTKVSVEANGTLTLDSGATNDYINDKVSLKVVTGATVNLNFAGAADKIQSLMANGLSQPPGVYGGLISGAPNQLPQFTGTGTIIARAKAVSRKVHGAAGTFDIDLPFSGPPGVECRSGGPDNDYQIVVNFFNDVTFRSAIVVSGTGLVAGSSGNGTNMVTINLSNVANAQTIKIALVDLNDGTSTNSFPIALSVLVGDITGDGAVNGSDVTAVKHTSLAVDASTFRADVIPNGVHNSSDVSIVKFNSGTALPSASEATAMSK